MHNTLRSEKTKLLLLALSLATLDIWGDMKGASALFVQINSIVGSALINGRMIGLTGIAICSAIAALKPSIVLFPAPRFLSSLRLRQFALHCSSLPPR